MGNVTQSPNCVFIEDHEESGIFCRATLRVMEAFKGVYSGEYKVISQFFLCLTTDTRCTHYGLYILMSFRSQNNN